jgi:hypothetical protein
MDMTGVVCSVGRGLWWLEREVLRSLVMERLTEPKVGKGALEGFWDTDWEMGVGRLFGPKGRRERRERKVGIALLGVGEAMVGAEVEVEGAGEEVEDIEEVEGRRGEGIRDTGGKVLPLGGWERCGVEEIMLVGLGVESQSRLECSICVCKRF